MTGSTLKWHRKRLHLTQAKLAAVLDVHRITVTRWETDKLTIPTTVAKLVPLLKKEGAK